MAVESTKAENLETLCTASNEKSQATVVRRSRGQSISGNSDGSIDEICLTFDSSECSLLNFAVMENASFVTKKRRSRATSSDQSEDDRGNGQRKSKDLSYDTDFLEQTASENFVVMENASIAIRRRRLRPTSTEIEETDNINVPAKQS